MTSLYAAPAVLFLGFACTMNTKIISRKDCKGAQFHFLFWKEKQLCQGWTGKPQSLCRRVSLPRHRVPVCHPMRVGESTRDIKQFIEQIKIGI